MKTSITRTVTLYRYTYLIMTSDMSDVAGKREYVSVTKLSDRKLNKMKKETEILLPGVKTDEVTAEMDLRLFLENATLTNEQGDEIANPFAPIIDCGTDD